MTRDTRRNTVTGTHRHTQTHRHTGPSHPLLSLSLTVSPSDIVTRASDSALTESPAARSTARVSPCTTRKRIFDRGEEEREEVECRKRS